MWRGHRFGVVEADGRQGMILFTRSTGAVKHSTLARQWTERENLRAVLCVQAVS